MQPKHAPWIVLLAAWLHPSDSPAQFGQNAQLPNNVYLLPRVGSPPASNQRFYPFSNGNPFNNFPGFGGTSAFGGRNPYAGPNNFGSPWGAGFGNNGFGNPWGGGFGNAGTNQFGSGGYGYGGSGYGGYGGLGYNGFGNGSGFSNLWATSAPFGGYNFTGYGNHMPIVGVNNGWWPYEPAYNSNSPINQYLQQLYLQGLPNLNNLPGNGKILPQAP
ncbi:MAG: hypothetical protein L0Y71_22135 [Gemmataceae bacterium]|nr:hypothetical protein [Gemmataceae bacterium]